MNLPARPANSAPKRPRHRQRSAGAAASAPAPAAAPGHHRHRPTVLVVEDNLRIRQALSRLLVTHGYECIAAKSGGAAYSEFVRRKVDLIITDLIMPSGDGFVLIQRIRQVSAVPVIVITCMDPTHPSVLDLSHLDDISLMLKPFSSPVLMRQVNATVARWAGISARPPLGWSIAGQSGLLEMDAPPTYQ